MRSDGVKGFGVELDRVVQVRLFPRGGGEPYFGSGYLVAPRLVLTAAHVLGDGALAPQPGRLTVVAPGQRSGVPVPGSGGQVAAQVVWYVNQDRVDAALVEICDEAFAVPVSLREGGAVARWGRLVGAQSHPVSLAGFPRMQRDEQDAPRAVRRLDGKINPGNQSPDGRYEISSTDPTRQPWVESGATPWSGVSGAAVLVEHEDGDLLCAVVRHDLRGQGGTILTGTPAATLLEHQDFRAVVAAHSGGMQPVAEPAEPAHLLTPAVGGGASGSVAWVLRAEVEAVEFSGRDAELARLLAWCLDEPQGLAIRVLTGAGGQGKSRLARELTKNLERNAEWAVGHLRAELTDFTALADFAPLRMQVKLLLVVDYAETRPRVVRKLVATLSGAHRAVRLLLLARSDGLWLTDTLDASARTTNLLNDAVVDELPELHSRDRHADELGDGALIRARERAFAKAVRDLARLLPRVAGLPVCDWESLADEVRASEDLTLPCYANALTLQLAALTGLLQRGPAPVNARPGEPLEAVLLQHEERYWHKSAAAPAFRLEDLPTPTQSTAVAAAALCGASTNQEAHAVLGVVPELPGGRVPSATRWLAGLYPPELGRVWGSLHPDRIAEYHAARAITGEWISPAALLAIAAPAQQAQLIIVLARAAVAHYNAQRPGTSDQTIAALDNAVRSTTPHYLAARTAAIALPYPSRIINPVALYLTRLQVEYERRLAADDPEVWEPDLARSLANLGIRLTEAGRHAEALDPAQQATQIFRRLAADNPRAWEPDLAASLSNLGVQLRDLGRHAEALDAMQQAIEIRERLTADSSADYEHVLGRSLSNLGVQLGDLGRRAEALDAIQQATQIFLHLAADNPAAWEPELAGSLSNLGVQLGDLGRRAEALDAIQQAVEIYRRLAADDPAAWEPELARTLSNLSVWLTEAGRRAEALDAEQQAVKIYRRLTADNPAAYEPDLARTLANLGIRLGDLGRRAEALHAAQQAVEIRQRLTADNPAAYEPGLAHSMANLGIRLAEAGRHAAALNATQQAVEIYRRLAADNPAAHEPDLGRSLSNLGVQLGDLGRRAEALDAIQQATQIFLHLAAANPAAWEPDLARALANLGIRLGDLGRRAEALDAAQQATQIFLHLAAANPAAWEPDLAHSLSLLGIRLAEAGRHAAALNATQQAVEIYRRLAANNRAAYEPKLASSLSNLGIRLGEAGRRAEALDAELQAVEIRRRLAAENRAAYEPELAASLCNLGVQLAEAGRHAEALNAAQQAAQIFRRLAANSPAAHIPSLAKALAAYAVILHQSSRHRDSLAPLLEGLALANQMPEHVQPPANMFIAMLRSAYTADTPAVTDQFQRLTGLQPPHWMTEPL